MFDAMHILALSTTAIIFAVVIAVIWLIGGMLSAGSKQREAERREKVRRALEEARRTAPDWGQVAQQPAPPMPPRPVAYAPPKPPPLPPKQAQQARRPKQKKRKPPPEIAVARELPTETHVAPPMPDIQVVAAARKPLQSPPADAAALRTWLKPATMRQQFILTEILRPPIGLREPGQT